MAGNPVLGFLSVQPTGDGPHATVTKMLRLLGILVIVGAGLAVIDALLGIAMGAAYSSAATGASAVVGLVFALIFAALVLWWITFTITAWNNRDPRGNTHALVIAILATVFGALGVLGGLVGGVFLGAAIFVAGVSPLFMVLGLLRILLAGAEAYCGIMILVNRNKVAAGTNPPVGATN